MNHDRPKKLQRISQACDLCHRRSIRCRPSSENPQQKCQNCYDFGVECTYKRPSRRRRNPSNAHTSQPNLLPGQQIGTSISPGSEEPRGQESSYLAQEGHHGQSSYPGAHVTVRTGQQDDELGIAWRSFTLASAGTIEQYLRIYMDIIYPIYPLFHGPTMWEHLQKQCHLTNRAFFASIMAACALAAARARDGATGDSYSCSQTLENSSEIFFAAAQDAIWKDLSRAQGLGYMRACCLLALTSIQYGQIQSMHQYMGTYHSLSAMQHFHDESKWPTGISVVEREERRRLFWAMYSLDIYTSVVFDAVIKSQETHSNVRYPVAADDEELLADANSPTNEDHWLYGWNFVTDLYRILEHSAKRMRRNKQIRDDRISITRMLIADGIPEAQVMNNVLDLYYSLPGRFKDYSVPVTGDNTGHDFYGFQAANIQATLQLVRMTLFSTSYSHDVNQKCTVAEQMLSAFHSMAPHYLRAISTPLVYQLGGIGQILASVMEGSLCEESYQRVRGLLVSMADLLQGLESGLQRTAGASRDLRKQIDKIDQYMNTQREYYSAAAQPQYQSMLGSTDLSNGVVSLGQQQHHQPNISAMHDMNVQPPFEEFQLPHDLVNNEAWPWPFGLAHETQATVHLRYG